MRSAVVPIARCGGTMVTTSCIIHVPHSFTNAPRALILLSLSAGATEVQFASPTGFRFDALDRKRFAHKHVGCLTPATIGASSRSRGTLERHRSITHESSSPFMPKPSTLRSHQRFAQEVVIQVFVFGGTPALVTVRVSVLFRYHAVQAHRRLNQCPRELHASGTSRSSGIRGVSLPCPCGPGAKCQHHQGLHGHDHVHRRSNFFR